MSWKDNLKTVDLIVTACIKVLQILDRMIDGLTGETNNDEE